MSVIQKIRDKYARWAVIAIGLSLLGFILMDAFAGRTGLLNSGPGTTVGKVDGTSIDRKDFDRKVEELLAQYGEGSRSQIMNYVWNQEVENLLVKEQAEKLGLTVTEKEMRDVLYGANPPQFLAQYFTDRNTGKFDAIAAQQQVNQILKKGTPGQQDYDFITRNIEQTKNQRLLAKYMALMMNTIYFPKWMIEKKNADNSLAAKVSYVEVPFASIPDSTIRISDEEIRDYMKEHKDDYEREKETRTVEYVLFPVIPSAADSAAVRKDLEQLRPQFAAAKDPSVFIAQQSSAFPYDSAYNGKATIQVPAKDSIFNTPVGGIYGPYVDQNNYVMAKVIDIKMLPDSVKCRHILLGTVNPQTGQPLMPDSVAKAKADSIAQAIKNGASFDLLDSLYSTDEAAKKDKGVMTFSSAQIQSQNFAKEFGQFILFDGKPGESKVVKTQFGWHYIEILKYINVEPHYKVAYLAKPIIPSQETDDEARNLATMFAGDSRDIKTFNNYYEKNLRNKGFTKQIAPDLDEMAFDLPGVSSVRPFIRKVFEADKGDVIGPEQVNDNYIVGVVTVVNKPGLPDVAAVRNYIEPILRNKKKGEMIAQKIGKVTSLQEVATKMNLSVQTADSIHLNTGGGSLGGYESKVLGAVFNPANKGKLVTEPLIGSTGVFVINVENIYTTPVETANIEEQQKQMETALKNQTMQQFQYNINPVLDPLKKAASIKDRRAKFY